MQRIPVRSGCFASALLLVCCLSLVMASLPTHADGQTPDEGLEKLLPGVWRGVHLSGFTTYHDRIDVRQDGANYVADGLSWCGMTEEQAQAALRDQLQSGVFPNVNKNQVHPICIQQQYTVSLQNGVVSFKSADRPKMVRVQSIRLYNEALNDYGPPMTVLVKRLDHNGTISFETQAGGTIRRHVTNVEYNAYTDLFAGYAQDSFSGRLHEPGIVVQDGFSDQNGQGFFRLWKEQAIAKPQQIDLEKGKIHSLVCLDSTRFHYSCYLPASYDPAKPMPVLVNASPNGDAQPLSPKMAERLGWIMVGLSGSKNDQFGPMAANRDAVLFDLRRRFNIDWKRVYFSGFSGGARAASLSAVCYPDACAGVLCICASCMGFVPMRFIPIYFLTGESDPTKQEVTTVYTQEKQAGRNTQLAVQPDGHDWGRPEDHETALQWLATTSTTN